MNDPKSIEQKKEELRAMIREEVEKAVGEVYSKAVIPKGYIRCKTCGELIRDDDKPCPYCIIDKEIQNVTDDILEELL